MQSIPGDGGTDRESGGTPPRSFFQKRDIGQALNWGRSEKLVRHHWSVSVK